MYTGFVTVFRFLFCRRRSLLLAICCIAGFALGMIIAQRTDDSYFSMMRMALSSHVSIPGLVASVSLPFLFAVFSVFIGHCSYLYCLCFIKMFFFGFGSAAAQLAFGSAGWLVRLLLFFSDSCLVPVFCWFCIRRINGSDQTLFRDIFVCAAVIVTVTAIDIVVISPFLASLINY